MSWIFGLTGKLSDQNKTRLYSICKDRIGEIQSKDSIVLYGGILQNIYINGQGSKRHIVVGIPLKSKNNNLSKLTANDINDEITNKREFFDGHYLAVRIDENEICITNDLLGIKDCYIAKLGEQIVFSSRLDFICQFIENTNIDFEQFSTTWLFQNQISTKSRIKNIKRLGPGGKATILKNKDSYEKLSWIPELNKQISTEKVISNLSSAVSIWKDEQLSLGLSGGLDSRFLLSLLQNNQQNYRTHTFGDIQNPDGYVADKIISSEFIEHLTINEYPQDIDAILKTINKYIGLSGVIAPATEFLQYDFYKKIADENYVIIDGGFGEIFRRQFLNRAAIKGKNDIINKNFEKLIPHFLYQKANIFSHEINQIFNKGLLSQLEELFDFLPDPKKIGTKNWLDLVALKSRLPNIYGGGQNSLDTVSKASMPFALQSTLQDAFSLSLHQRKNGQFFKKNINQKLKKYPLVKSGTTYPFGLSTITSWGWTKIKNKLGNRYIDNHVVNHLDKLEEYIQDLVLSEDVKNYAPYDYDRIEALVTKYYKGEKHLAVQLDWWLSFELWRKSLSGK